MCHSGGTGLLSIMCYTRWAGMLTIMCYLFKRLVHLPLCVTQGLAHLPLCVTQEGLAHLSLCVAYKILIHLPLCVTQEGVSIRDWHAGQHALLSLLTIMHYSTGMLSIRCCLSGSCVLAIIHFWHACNVLLNRLAYVCLPTI